MSEFHIVPVQKLSIPKTGVTRVNNLCNTGNSTAVPVSCQKALDPHLAESLVATCPHPVMSPTITKNILDKSTP